MNALELLGKDHFTLRNLFGRFDRTSNADYEKRTELLDQIRRELQIHSQAEEQIFYPAIKAFNGEGVRLVAQALRDHRDIDRLSTQISRLKLTDKSFDEMFEMLVESVEHHIEEEEGEIFQFAKENCSERQLEDLGRQIEERKRILDQQMAA